MITIQKKYYYLYFGLIAGLVFILYHELSNSVLRSAGGLGSIIGMLAHFFIILYSIRYYMKNFSEGYISYGQAYKMNLLLSLIGGGVNLVYIYAAFKLKPGMLAELKVLTEETYLSSGMPEDQVELMSKMLEVYLTPFMVALSSFMIIIFGSLLLGLIISSIVKKEQNPLEKTE